MYVGKYVSTASINSARVDDYRHVSRAYRPDLVIFLASNVVTVMCFTSIVCCVCLLFDYCLIVLEVFVCRI